MAKKAQDEDQVMDQQPAAVMVEALVPMWGDKDVVSPGTRYHLPQATAEYLAGLGFVAILAEEAD
jgi:hypothetical protein